MFRIRFIILSLIATNAAVFSQNITVRGEWGQRGYFSDCWGYDAADGRYYAIAGAREGTSVLDVTNPSGIVEIGYIEGPSSIWRDIKTYRHYAYICNDTEGGLDILDLSGLPEAVEKVKTIAIQRFHNLYIDTTRALMYLADAGTNGSVHVYTLSDPESPKYITEFGTESHDVYVRDNMAYVAQGRKGSVGFYDVSNLTKISSPRQLVIPNSGYVHNTWLSKDGNTLISTEETNNKTVKIWDISDLENIELISEYLGPSPLAHNVHVEGDYLYISHYESGLSVVDIKNPGIAAAVGLFYDFPGHESPGRTWGVYPHSKSGYIYISDMNYGLYVLQFNGTKAAYFTGKILDSESMLPIEGCQVSIASQKVTVASDAEGLYSLGYGLSDKTQISYQFYGYKNYVRDVNVVGGITDETDVYLQKIPKTSFKMHVKNQNGDPIAGAKVSFKQESDFFSEDFIYATVTDAQGFCEIEDLMISDPQQARYGNLLIEGPFPYTKFVMNTLTMQDTPENELEITLESADVLVLNKDPNGNYGNFYASALNQLDTKEYILKINTKSALPSLDDVNAFPASYIIWMTGDAVDSVLTPSEIDFIKNYLQSGGNVILSGQNIAEYLSGKADPFLTDWLHCSYVGNISSLLMESAMEHQLNDDFSGAAIFGLNGAGNQFSQDAIESDHTANVTDIFYYIDNPDKIAAVAIEYPEYESKLFFASFGLEAIGNSSDDYISLAQLLANVQEWFSGPYALSINPAGEKKILDFMLSQNYPNPFNPSTIIKYQIAHQSKVTLAVYDISGRMVDLLVDEQQNAGTYATEFYSKNLASGVYFYRLQTDYFSDIKQMILIK